MFAKWKTQRAALRVSRKRSADTMLSNDKYSGDATIFRRYSIGFPDTKRKSNDSTRTMYQAIGSHPAIISKEAFDEVQAEGNAEVTLSKVLRV